MQALLHLLLKISESVTRLESMLLITSPDTGGKDAIENGSNFLVYPSHSEEGNDEKYVFPKGEFTASNKQTKISDQSRKISQSSIGRIHPTLISCSQGAN